MDIKGDFYPAFTANPDRYSPEDKACIEDVVRRLSADVTSENNPGMLLGKIQSGKTKTFLGIMALAYDNGFDVTVVLTKGTKALAKQTHQRIKSEFKAYEDADKLRVFDIMTMPDNLPEFELNQKLAIVVKKQVDNMKRLIALFEYQYPQLGKKKLLIIDDEADYASVGFKKDKNGELDINKTAKQLETLRGSASKAAFLQVTATPYSLYLQPPKISVKGIAFKPIRPSFTVLVPVNPHYIGSDYYFQDSQDNNDKKSLASYLHEPVDQNELTVLRKKDLRRVKLAEVLTSDAITSLRDAICNFMVGGCIRRLQEKRNGSTTLRKYSFLVHTEAGKAAHAWQEELVDQIQKGLVSPSKENRKVVSQLIVRAYTNLQRSVEHQKDFMPSLADVHAEVSTALAEGWLMITKVNSERQIESLLDQDGQLQLRTPLNIFIGGQILDRGITIANLIGFYYGRKPNVYQQDTVLQHSRMFGFRPKQDLAVTRFYTEQSIYSAMRRMHEVDIALREALAKSPDQGVVFIQKAPGNRVIPCSPNKIALSRTTTLKPHKRLLPVGFETLAKTRLRPITDKLDKQLESLLGTLTPDNPKLVSTADAIKLLEMAKATFEFADGYSFDWDAAKSSLTYLAELGPENKRGHVWLMAYTDRKIKRLAAAGSHAEYVEPDSTRTEGAVRKQYAVDNPILIMIRQNGAADLGWSDGPFWWPVISAQKNTPTSIFANETLKND